MKHRKQAFNPEGKLFVGLGNPGKAYERTYHNIGLETIRHLSGSYRSGFVTPSRKHFSYVQPGTFPGTVFALSGTFMNESGIAVREALAYFKKDAHDLVVVHDDTDMRVGSFKIGYNQRSAGHHGVDSIIGELGGSEFFRLKVGVRPVHERSRKKAQDFVLKKISATDGRIFETVFRAIMQKVLFAEAE